MSYRPQALGFNFATGCRPRPLLSCRGFGVYVTLNHEYSAWPLRDAIGGTSNEEGDGVQAALVNFRFLAHALWTTDEAATRFADLSR
jgi:hypothetical protein